MTFTVDRERDFNDAMLAAERSGVWIALVPLQMCGDAGLPGLRDALRTEAEVGAVVSDAVAMGGDGCASDFCSDFFFSATPSPAGVELL